MSGVKPDLSILREIGWRLWDPIGLNTLDPNWQDTGADEYDTYLLRACGMLVNGSDVEEVARYLNGIAEDYITVNEGGLPAAKATAQALDQYVRSTRET